MGERRREQVFPYLAGAFVSAEVINFPGDTTLPEPPAATLEKAKGWDLESCVIVGWDRKGDLVLGGSFCETGEILILLEKAKMHLMATV